MADGGWRLWRGTVQTSSHVSMDVIIISRRSPLRVQDECQMTVEGNTASMTSDELIFGKSRRPEWGDKLVKI